MGLGFLENFSRCHREEEGEGLLGGGWTVIELKGGGC